MTFLSSREKLKEIYYTNDTVYRLMYWPKKLVDIIRFRLVPAKWYIQYKYYIEIGSFVDFKAPKTLTEKIQWMKLYDHNPLYVQAADKHAVREYIKEKIGAEYLVPLELFTYEVDRDIVPENLPDYPFILKTNHDSSGGFIVRDKTEVDWPAIRKKLKVLIDGNYYWKSKEWAYKDIKPGIVVEKLLMDKEGKIPFDYKFHCFHGKPEVIMVEMERETNLKRNWYDVNWSRLDMKWRTKWKEHVISTTDYDVSAPDNLEELICIASILSEDFNYVRVDLYSLNNRIYFGELTLYTNSGIAAIKPVELSIELGAKLNLPKKS